MTNRIIFSCIEDACKNITESWMGALGNLLYGLAFEPFLAQSFQFTLISYKCLKKIRLYSPSSIYHSLTKYTTNRKDKTTRLFATLRHKEDFQLQALAFLRYKIYLIYLGFEFCCRYRIIILNE